jgi:hypothetical protein
MTGEFYVDEKSLKDLRINMKVFTKELLAESVKGLASFGMKIVAKAQRTLRKNGNYATSNLIASGRTVIQPDNTVDAGFYMGYAYWVENGRKSGKIPPVDVIYGWIKKKKLTPTERKEAARAYNKEVKSTVQRRKRLRLFKKKMSDEERARWQMAWAIAQSIGEKGTKPHPFLKPAYDEYRTQIAQFMQQKINAVCDKFKAK